MKWLISTPGHSVLGLIFLLIFAKVNAQTPPVAAQIDTLIAQSLSYANIDLDTAEMYALQAVELLPELKGTPEFLDSMSGAACLQVGKVFASHSNYDTAKLYYNRAREHFDKGKHWKNTILVMDRISSMHHHMANYEKAVAVGFEALEIAESHGDSLQIAKAYNMIAMSMYYQDMVEESQRYYEKAVEIMKDMPPTEDLATALRGLGYCYLWNSSLHASLEYYKRSLATLRKVGASKIRQASLINDIGNNLKHMERWDEALTYYKRSLDMSKEVDFKLGIMVMTANIGDVYHRQDQYAKALPYTIEAVAMMEESSNKLNLLENYDILTTCYEGLGDYKNAFKYNQLRWLLKDSMLSVEKTTVVSELEAKYETAQKEAEIEQLQQTGEIERRKRQAQFTWFAAGLALLLGGGLALFFYLKNKQDQRNQAQLVEAERQRNAHLQRLDKLKDQFLANTSHELRTPLNGIIGLSESMLDRVDSKQDKRDLHMIASSGKRLSSLVNDILDFSKLKHSELQLRKRAVNLRVLTDIVMRISEPLIKGKALELINDIPEGTKVFGDEDRLQQILHNLIGNGVKFTETGSVRVHCSTAGGELIEVAITDTGIGIPEAHRENIFNTFEQGDGSVERKYGGTGLGLSISQSLVELHGGKIRMESEEGKGTTFYFTLPTYTGQQAEINESIEMAEPMEQTQPLSMASELLRPESGNGTTYQTARQPESLANLRYDDKTRILIVDDEPINQQVLQNHLTGDRFELQMASNGSEALELVGKHHFDLILLDIMMPRMSGYEVCREIRNSKSASELPVIMVTAKDQVRDLVEGLNLGANDYLSKPFSKQEFLARVKTQLNLKYINSATQKFVPGEFLKSIGRSDITEVRRGDQAERYGTVMFCDIRGYTTLSESLTPSETFILVNKFMGTMGPLIREHQGFVNQFLGDGIMALFMESPTDSLNAAIAIQSQMRVFNEQQERDGQPTLLIGIGMHSGDLMLGVIGDNSRLDAGLISDTVNTASRMEGLTKIFGSSIMISDTTHAKLDASKFGLRFLGEVQVKGKVEPAGIYECFDANPEEKAQKEKSMPLFEEGYRNFEARKFAEATVCFNQVLKDNPEDRAAKHFLRRAAGLITRDLPAEWTAIETMETK